MARNTELLLTVLEHIESHQEQWNQGNWFTRFAPDESDAEATACKTSFCYAGHVAVLEGAKTPTTDHSWGVAPNLEPVRWVDSRAGCGVPHCESCNGNQQLYDAMPEGTVHVSTFARERLGLTEEEGEVLFDGGNTLEELRVIVEGFIDGADAATVERVVADLRRLKYKTEES